MIQYCQALEKKDRTGYDTLQKLFPEHMTTLIKLFDSNPLCKLGFTREELARQFNGMAVSLPLL